MAKRDIRAGDEVRLGAACACAFLTLLVVDCVSGGEC
jgi:hypothetical protein